MLNDIPEDQLAFPARVARVYYSGQILTTEQLDEELETLLSTLDRLEIEMRRNHRKVGKRPFASLDLDAFWRNEL